MQVTQKPMVLAAAALALMALAVWVVDAKEKADAAAIATTQFVFEEAPCASCHASTVVQVPGGGLVCAFFAGKDEGDPSVGIWLARHDGTRWSAPTEVATGTVDDGTRYPCWNPILFQPAAPADAPLMLFYKVGPSPSEWWGMLMTSADAGETWSTPVRLPDGI